MTIWRRYVDDTMVALCEDLLDEFTDHINSIHPAIKFTREEEKDMTIAMLDTKIKRTPAGNMSFTVYRKPTHTDQYLQFDSNQPLQHKLGVIKTLHHRCKTICSTEEDKLQEVEHLQKVLSISGHTRSAWVTATRTRKKTPAPASKDRNIRGSITLPYVGNVSNAIARVMRKEGIQVHLKPHNTIRSHLVHPKDKIPKDDKAGVVYHLKCNDCESHYIGETERKLRKRIHEHHRSSSPVGQHTKDTHHTFSEKEVSVLHQEQDWFRRGVAEAIYIDKERPDLNRDRGRHTLPAIYRELFNIVSRDHPTTSGSRDITTSH